MQYHNKELVGCPSICEDRLIGDTMHARQSYDGIRRLFQRMENRQGGFSEVRVGEVPRHFMLRHNHTSMTIFLMLSQHIPLSDAGPTCQTHFSEVKRKKHISVPLLFSFGIALWRFISNIKKEEKDCMLFHDLDFSKNGLFTGVLINLPIGMILY